MSRMRPFVWLAALWAVLGLAAPAGAQHFQPFIDPGYFQPDFQFFAPAEISDFGGGEPPNTGVYITYDRIYINVTRPDDPFSFNSETQGDFTWGNRFEAGYMTAERTGWQAVLLHIGGPNENFVNSDDTRFVTVDDASGTAITSDIVVPGGIDSINLLTTSSLELNKIWRRKEFHNGTVFEPLAGFRYMNVKDEFQRDEFDEVLINVPPNVNFLLHDIQRSHFENEMYGGQLGGRVFHQRGHWLLSAEFKFFALANFQSLQLIEEQITLEDPDPDDGVTVDIIGPDVVRQTIFQRADMFVWGGEVRGEAAYELTRDISLRFGFMFLDLGQGIGRGNVLRNNNQDVQYAGLTFGVTINR